VFGAANVPFIYVSVNIWRTIHPKTTVATTLPPGMGWPFLFSTLTLLAFYVLLMTVRVRLEAQRARLDGLYLAREE
jgi:hypothetical protein